MRILLIDNYDSFTYNLVQYLMELGVEVEVYRNDRITLEEVEDRSPEGLVISPGPGTPARAGISVPLIQAQSGKRPILGVCLGHQAVAAAFGARIVQAQRIMHGKTSMIHHQATELFRDLENPIRATRYHSLLVDEETLPADLQVTAWTADPGQLREVMGLRHRECPIWGVQFHPESVLTEGGKELLRNFLDLARSRSG